MITTIEGRCLIMRKLNDIELYKRYLSASELNNIRSAITMKLNQNVGNIAPEQIQPELVQLRTRSKNSYFALLSDALALYEQRGLLKLFNLGTTNSGRSPIPSYMPFIAAPGSTPNDRAIYVNMYRIGNWAQDESSYNNLSAGTDLYACLETGVIAYKMTVQGMADKVFESKQVLEYLTKIYTSLFAQTMVKTKTKFGSEFQTDAAYFMIARFFLLYVLGKSDTGMTDDYAYMAITHRSSMEALKAFEANNMINYDSLSGFLKSFGETFFSEGIILSEFENNWVRMYGEGMVFAIEYVPYLLHFLFASLHGATLGGSTRLFSRAEDLKKLGLPRLYNAVISALK